MTASRMNPQVDLYLKKAKKWQEELGQLREIILDCQFTEELKWGKPCYDYKKSNVVILLPLKEYCAVLFCKGALLEDTHGLLIKPGENTQAARQWRFTNLQEIVEKRAILKAYLHEAIDKADLEVVFKKITEFAIPEELQKKLDESPALKASFQALTPGRQRAYLLYFSAPKQSKTRDSRVEKCRSQILKGKGLNDD